MYELLLRTETLFLGLSAPILLAIGLPALVIGLILWLGGTRYSTAITGLLGAMVGSAAGLMIGQSFELHPVWSMLIGAVVLAAVSVALKKVLILVLAVLVISAVSGAGYLTVILDRVAPPPPPEPEIRARADYAVPYQSFSAMDSEARVAYVDEISGESETFSDRLRAVLDNTWQAIRPHAWMVVIAVIVGGVIGALLVWFIAKVVIPLAYSIVGTAAIFLGVQAALLGVGYPAVSALNPTPWVLRITFITMTAIGWVWQLFHARPKPVREPKEQEKPSE